MGNTAKKDPERLSASIAEFSDSILRLPWGSIPKVELEFKIFEFLVGQSKIDLTGQSDTALASTLFTTPARVRALRFKWEQRKMQNLTLQNMFEHVIPHEVTPGGDELIIRVDSTYVLDRLIDELRSQPAPVLVRNLRSPGHIQVNVLKFWIKANSLAAELSDSALTDMTRKLEDEFPDRSLKRAKNSGAKLTSKVAELSTIADFLNSVVKTAS